MCTGLKVVENRLCRKSHEKFSMARAQRCEALLRLACQRIWGYKPYFGLSSSGSGKVQKDFNAAGDVCV